MKYKVGDIVTVRKGLIGHNVYDNLYFATEMEKFCGHSFVIANLTFGNKHYVLAPLPNKKYPRGIRSDIPTWVFNDVMLEQLYVSELCEFIRKEVQC